MKLFLSFVVTLLLATTISANCGKKEMHQANYKSEYCSMHMKKQKCDNTNCKMESKKQSCNMENCNHKQKMMHKKSQDGMSCKMNGHHKGMKKEAKSCGCGMSVKSCKKMMKTCKFRDAKEAKTTPIKEVISKETPTK